MCSRLCWFLEIIIRVRRLNACERISMENHEVLPTEEHEGKKIRCWYLVGVVSFSFTVKKEGVIKMLAFVEIVESRPFIVNVDVSLLLYSNGCKVPLAVEMTNTMSSRSRPEFPVRNVSGHRT